MRDRKTIKIERGEMKIKTSLYKKGLLAIALAIALGVGGLAVQSPQAMAAGKTCTWTGAGGDNKFSTAGNWSGVMGG